MPIVINEILITTSVTEKPSGNATSTGTADTHGSSLISKKEKQQIITECIDEVMRILKDKTDR